MRRRCSRSPRRWNARPDLLRCQHYRGLGGIETWHTLAGEHRLLGSRDRAGGPRPGDIAVKIVLRRRDGVRRRAEHAGQSRRCGLSRHAAGDQSRMRRAGRAHRAWPERADQHGQPVRPQELFLCRSARRAIRSASIEHPIVGKGEIVIELRRWFHEDGRHHAAASGTGCRQVVARPASDEILHRPEPRRRGADGDRVGTRHALARRSRGLSAQAARDFALSRHLRRQHGGRLHALPTSTCRCASTGDRLSHALRDEERQLDPLRRCRRWRPRRNARSRSGKAAARCSRRRGCSTAIAA